MLSQKPHIYYVPDGLKQEFVVDKFNEKMCFEYFEESSSEIFIDNEKVFDSIKISYNGEVVIFHFGNYVKLEQKKTGEVTYTYDLKGNVYERIKIVKFTINILENKGFVVNNKHGDIGIDLHDSKQIEWLKGALEILKKVKKLIEYLGISKNLDLDNFHEEEVKQINVLYYALFNEALIHFDGKSDGDHLFEVAGIKLILFVKKQTDNSARIFNYFDYNCNFKMIDTEELISNYVIIGDSFPRQNLLDLVDNIDYERMVKEICTIKNDKKYYRIVNSLMVRKMAKRNEVKDKDYVVRRMFEKTNKSILNFMLEHFEPD